MIENIIVLVEAFIIIVLGGRLMGAEKEALYWMNRPNTGPVWAHFIEDGTWVCGGCGARNAWDRYACHFCQRQRKNGTDGRDI